MGNKRDTLLELGPDWDERGESSGDRKDDLSTAQGGDVGSSGGKLASMYVGLISGT